MRKLRPTGLQSKPSRALGKLRNQKKVLDRVIFNLEFGPHLLMASEAIRPNHLSHPPVGCQSLLRVRYPLTAFVFKKVCHSSYSNLTRLAYVRIKPATPQATTLYSKSLKFFTIKPATCLHSSYYSQSPSLLSFSTVLSLSSSLRIDMLLKQKDLVASLLQLSLRKTFLVSPISSK